MAHQITLKRYHHTTTMMDEVKHYRGIALLTESGLEIGTLDDEHDAIIFDPWADGAALFGDGPETDWPAVVAELGLDVETIRQIDAMPAPDVPLND